MSENGFLRTKAHTHINIIVILSWFFQTVFPNAIPFLFVYYV